MLYVCGCIKAVGDDEQARLKFKVLVESSCWYLLIVDSAKKFFVFVATVFFTHSLPPSRLVAFLLYILSLRLVVGQRANGRSL